VDSYFVLHCEKVDEMGGAYSTCWT